MEADLTLSTHVSQDNVSAFAFPVSLAEKYRPTTIADFVGLEKAKRIMAKFAARPYQSSWLFVGPPGVGKTSMALALASQIGAEIHHIPSQKCNAQAIDDVCRTCAYVPLSGGFHLVIVDEADRMTPAAQLSLLSKLDATDQAPNTIWIFTCNETGSLEPRFLSRCRVIEFSLLRHGRRDRRLSERVWHSEGGNGDCPDLTRLAKETRNNVRDCLMRLEVELMAYETELYSTGVAAKRIGVSFRTLNRWLNVDKIKPSVAIPFSDGRMLWRWTDADIAKAKKVKAAQKPGPKPRPSRGRPGKKPR